MERSPVAIGESDCGCGENAAESLGAAWHRISLERQSKKQTEVATPTPGYEYKHGAAKSSVTAAARRVVAHPPPT